MTDNNAIQLISDLLQTPGAVSGEPQTIAKFAQKYPYFIPVRYIKAKEAFKQDGFSQEMQSQAFPYINNWILFSNYLQDATGNDVTYPSNEEETETIYNSVPVEYVLPATEPEPDTTEELIASQLDETSAEPTNEAPIIEESVYEMPVRDEDSAEVAPDAVTEIAPAEVPEEIAQEEHIEITTDEVTMHTTAEPEQKEEPLFSPVSSEDYFLQQGIKVSGEIPEDVAGLSTEEIVNKDKALMVMMSFKDWLMHFKNSSAKAQEELADKKAVKTMWQKEKMAAAIQEENEEIPENVFEMAVNSITSEEDLASESLAEIHLKQQKYDKAIEMYRKLSLRNPEKNAYFAQKIKDILKEKEL